MLLYTLPVMFLGIHPPPGDSARADQTPTCIQMASCSVSMTLLFEPETSWGFLWCKGDTVDGSPLPLSFDALTAEGSGQRMGSESHPTYFNWESFLSELSTRSSLWNFSPVVAVMVAGEGQLTLEIHQQLLVPSWSKNTCRCSLGGNGLLSSSEKGNDSLGGLALLCLLNSCTGLSNGLQ